MHIRTKVHLKNLNSVSSIIQYLLNFAPRKDDIRFLNLVNFDQDQRTNALVRLCETNQNMKSCVSPSCAFKLKTNNRNTIIDIIRTISKGPIDLLYINHGLNDFWYLKLVMERFRPSIICITYNPVIPFHLSVTAPYLNHRDVNDMYARSSLKALCAILPHYMLWACLDDHFAFFVDDAIGQKIPKVNSQISFFPTEWQAIKHRFWVNVRSKIS